MNANRAVVVLSNLMLLPALLSTPAYSQWQPTKPVELWVTFGKGSHADLWAREVVSIIEEHDFSPVPINIMNIPEEVGVETFPKFQARSADNHTLMLILPNVYTAPIFKPEIGFDVMGTTPIANMGEETLGL